MFTSKNSKKYFLENAFLMWKYLATYFENEFDAYGLCLDKI